MLGVVNVKMACDGAECIWCSATSSFGAEPSKQHRMKGQSGQGNEVDREEYRRMGKETSQKG